jgi:hypothetical protein
LVISHIKIFIFGGTLPFQIFLWAGPASDFVNKLYIDLTENLLDLPFFQTTTSLES